MNIKLLRVKDYRNLEDTEIEFSDGINVFTGENAQGKTNILEAVWYFSACKSFRCSDDKEFIKDGKTVTVIESVFNENNRDNEARIVISTDKRREIKKNDVKIKASEMIGSFKTVIFFPEQLFLVKGSSEQRRKFLDFAISQLKPKYIEYLSKYNKILTQKNYMLRNNREEIKDTISQWNYALAGYGAYITVIRNSYIEKLKPIAERVCSEISDGRDKLELFFEASYNSSEIFDYTVEEYKNLLFEKMESISTEEINSGHSLIGSHRDDFSFSINGKSAKTLASQGQQRSCVISLKEAEADLIKEVSGEYPVLLYDDVFSELDATRKKYLLNKLCNKQVILTCCENIDGYNTMNGKIFTVSGGKVF